MHFTYYPIGKPEKDDSTLPVLPKARDSNTVLPKARDTDTALPKARDTDIALPKPRDTDGSPLVQKRVETDTGDDDVQYYKMKRPHGSAHIFNNIYFDNKPKKTRNGAKKDAENLKDALKELRYNVETHSSWSSTGIQEEFDKISERDYTKDDSIIFCLMSHGREGQVMGKDWEPVKIRDLCKKLAECETLIGKPKIFFIQACQGREKPKQLVPEDDKDVNPDEGVSALPRDSDFFFGYATTPETISLRHESTGTWYIQELCKVLKQNKHDLVTMVTIVHNAVATDKEYQYEVETDGEPSYYYRQQPQLISTLRHRVKF